LRAIEAAGLFAAIVTAVGEAAPARTSLVLVRDGQPVSSIVLAKEATRAAQFAACELQWHLRQITGAEVPLVSEEVQVSGVRIPVGESAATTRLGLKNASFRSQEYLVRFLPDALVLMGRDKEDRGVVKYDPAPDAAALETWPSLWDEQGTMYAVYDFLQRYCNVRWLNPTETGTDCPQTKTLTVSGSELRRKPFFRYRFAAYPSSESYDAYTGLWPAGTEGFKQWETAAYPALHQQFPEPGRYNLAKRGRVQLFRYRMREGGEKCIGNHSLYGYYKRFWEKDPSSPDVFVEKCADWFAQGYAGTPPQMCYTSPGLIRQVAQDARDYFDGKGINPWSLQPVKDRNDVWGEDFFCVEPMDNSQFCRCSRCQALLTQQRGFDPFFSNGRHSDYFFNFVNEVAKELGKTHPEKRIVTLAYMSHAQHPKRVKLEPNVVVQFCFACNRLNYDRASYEHEVALLNEWAAKEKGRPLYLWLYYTFPVEIANNGQFHCFPGFFARAVGEQFKLFAKCGIRGMFHCGYGQEVEAYLTYRLMDDPSLNTDKLLDEYFQRLYGPAADAMERLYIAIERTYSNPANYPEAIATGRKEEHHHQTEELAWGWLGTEKRMESFGRLLQEAKAAAKTEVVKHRVALFEKGTWDYMVAGRRLYMDHLQAKYGGTGAPLRVPFNLGEPLNGDATKLVRDDSAVLFGWRSAMGERTGRNVEARLVTDGKFLYVQCEEKVNPATLKAKDDVFAGDHWALLIAAQRQRPFREIAVGPRGACVAREHSTDEEAAPTACDVGATVVSGTKSKDRWRVSLALPLDKLVPGGVRPGGAVCLNLARRSPDSDDQPVWVPTFGDFRDPTRLRELVLEAAEAIPADVPSEAELRELQSRALVGRWVHDSRSDPSDRSDRSDATVHDTSPNRLTGKLVNGAAFAKDNGRTVVQLEDKRGQYVDLGNPEAANLSVPLTLEAWVKYEQSETWYPALFGKGYEQSGAYSLHLRPGLTIWFELDGEDGTRHFYNPTDLSLTPGAWNHVAATYDGAVMRVYINGRAAGAGKETKLVLRKTVEPLRLGWLGSYGYFNGRMRDVAIYGRAMPAGEVFARYRAGRAAP
jgi:hypothetical protein